MKQIFFLVASVFMLASCSLQKQTINTSKTLGVYGAGVIQSPVLTNLKVNPQKFTCKYTSNSQQDINYHKSQAVAKAMTENKADVIIEPTYDITSSVSNVTITLTGYAGSYENFRQLTSTDTALLLNAGIMNYNNGVDRTPAPQPAKKKGKGGVLVVLGILLAGATIIAGL